MGFVSKIWDHKQVRVLFDALYLCPVVVRACESNGFTFFSVAAHNRNFTTPNGKRRQIARLMPGLIRHKGKNVRMKRSRGTAKARQVVDVYERRWLIEVLWPVCC
ncbi:MAG TPA: hypothetical protein VGI81_16970 [Tepidisphaeraceae bacterium]|jgi:hypothetical protein